LTENFDLDTKEGRFMFAVLADDELESTSVNATLGQHGWRPVLIGLMAHSFLAPVFAAAFHSADSELSSETGPSTTAWSFQSIEYDVGLGRHPVPERGVDLVQVATRCGSSTPPSTPRILMIQA
jgi:hypothetical protein